MTLWALPENFEDVLPADAVLLERLRRKVLDVFDAHGYELVMPPLLEYVESLLSGVGNDMDLRTFKLVDQLSGKMMGVRADTTPQVARIDAHVLNRQGVSRLCYAGSVLHTRPAGLGQSRQPFQVGAELYGYAGLEADIEVQQLMLSALSALSVQVDSFSVGHPAIFRAITRLGGVSSEDAGLLFTLLAQKDAPGIADVAARYARVGSALRALPTLYGDVSTLNRAREVLPDDTEVDAALAQLGLLSEHFMRLGLPVAIDLSELGGYNYESGVVFSAYSQAASDAIARGGRYDGVGTAFGRARPATGFSLDLKAVLPLVREGSTDAARAPILAFDNGSSAFTDAVKELRAAGERVLVALPGEDPRVDGRSFSRQLQWDGSKWSVLPTDRS